MDGMDCRLIALFRGWSEGCCHRGFHDLARPENSLPAFEHAIENGLPFEFDVHLAKDGKLVVAHDSDLLRTTGKEGIIEELAGDYIQANYRYFDGSYPPFFEEVAAINHGRVPMVVELKTYPGIAKRLVDVALPYLEALPHKENVVVISFDAEILRELRARGCTLPLGWLHTLKTIKGLSVEDLEEFDFLDVESRSLFLHPKFRKYRRRGHPILAWTIHDRLTYFCAHRLAHGLTWEVVDSRKPPEKANRFIYRRFAPDSSEGK